MLGYAESRILGGGGGGSGIECVNIGGTCWMARNMDIDDGGNGIYYPNGDINNVPTHGLLYTWSAALRIASSISDFKMPTLSEANILSIRSFNLVVDSCGEYDLWADGVLRNDSYFQANDCKLIPSGYYEAGGYYYFGRYGYYWFDNGSGGSYYARIRNTSTYCYRGVGNSAQAYSVRLIKT